MLVAADLTRMKGRLAQLVSINTENPPGQEVEAVAYLAHELSRIGLSVETQEILPGRSNVVARLGNGPGPIFAFNSHIDVVPAGDGWTRPALALTEADGRLYGRGACDAKGPIVAMIEAIELLVAERSAWSGDLLAIFVADEEAQSRGAKAFVASKPRIDLAIIGEPTSNVVASAHKGSLRPRIRVSGKTAHSGMPHLGINAILEAGRLMGLVTELHERDIKQRSHKLVGSASITVTRIEGGHADNVIPDRCEFLIDRRLLPGETEPQAIAEIEELLKVARDRLGIRAEIIGFAPTTGGQPKRRSTSRWWSRRSRRPRDVVAEQATNPSAFQPLATSCTFAASAPRASCWGPAASKWHTSLMNSYRWTSSLPRARSTPIRRCGCCDQEENRESVAEPSCG